MNPPGWPASKRARGEARRRPENRGWAMSRKSVSGWAMALLAAALVPARAAWPLDADELSGFERTPPRLASSDGEVSFWRPDAGEWTPARVNTPLAVGDQLYTGADANLELQ